GRLRGVITRASGPNDSSHERKDSLRFPGTSASIQLSVRVFSTRAPGVAGTAHHATEGSNATRATPSGSPNPHGPARRCSAASNPSGGADAAPISFTGPRTRDRRYERISDLERSSPTRYQLPDRNTSEYGSTSRCAGRPSVGRYRNRTARRRDTASATPPRCAPEASTPGAAGRSTMAASRLVSTPEASFQNATTAAAHSP